MRGDSFLTNLTIRTPIETEASLADIYLSSEATYRVLLPGASYPSRPNAS